MEQSISNINLSIIIAEIFICYYCGSNKIYYQNQKKIPQIDLTNQEFDLNRFKGKWLTNSKYFREICVYAIVIKDLFRLR